MAGPALTVASTFTSTPLEAELARRLADQGSPAELRFAQYAALDRYLLTPAAADDSVALVLVRVEDWLRASPPAQEGAGQEQTRKLLRDHLDELVRQLQFAAQQRKVLLLCCPSRGHVARKRNLTALCRTFGNLLVTQVQAQTTAQAIGSARVDQALGPDADDPAGDRMGQVPYSQEAFDRLAAFAAAEIAAAVAGPKVVAPTEGSQDMLARFWAGLEVRLSLVRATPEDAPVLASLAHAGTTFRLRPDPRSEGELRASLGDAALEFWRVSLQDRFGSHADCGFVELSRDGDLKVRQMVLTCPVLGKQAEHGLLVQVARLGRAYGCAQLRIGCAPGPDTESARAFLAGLVAPAELAGDELVLPTATVEPTVLTRSAAPEAVLASVERAQGS